MIKYLHDVKCAWANVQHPLLDDGELLAACAGGPRLSKATRTKYLNTNEYRTILLLR
jgi:hypothetical protein